MGKKRGLKRLMKEAAALPHPRPLPPALTPAEPWPDDDEVVIISMALTRGDRLRLRKMALHMDNTSLQRLGHRAWNSLLASHGLPGLTPVLQGKGANRASRHPVADPSALE